MEVPNKTSKRATMEGEREEKRDTEIEILLWEYQNKLKVFTTMLQALKIKSILQLFFVPWMIFVAAKA